MQEEINKGVVLSRTRADERCFRKWKIFFRAHNMDIFLDKVRDPVLFLQFFTRQVRSGLLAHNGEPVRSRNAEAYLRAVGHTFANVGIGDPHLNKHGRIEHSLQRQLRGWTKSDGPLKGLKPINIGLIHHTFAALHLQNNNKSNCLKWIIYVAVFLLNRPGECSMTSGESHPFRWCDIQLYMGQLQLDVFGAKAYQLRAADWYGMTFTVQKSGVLGEIVGHAHSGALHECPVVGLLELCLLLHKYGAPHDAPLGTYQEMPYGPLCYIKSSDITKALKSADHVHGTEFGIGPDDVSAGCLCYNGDMAILCGGVESSCIRLLGRWKSWTILRYLHLQSQAAMCGLSAAMLQGGRIDMLPPGSLTSIFPEPPDVPACITPTYSEVYETL